MMLDPGRVQAVFLAALEPETLADRDAVVDREFAADDELRCRVEALLSAHDRPDNPLDRPFIVSGEPSATTRLRPADDLGPPPFDQELKR